MQARSPTQPQPRHYVQTTDQFHSPLGVRSVPTGYDVRLVPETLGLVNKEKNPTPCREQYLGLPFRNKHYASV